jgi:hypothetical protein
MYLLLYLTLSNFVSCEYDYQNLGHAKLLPKHVLHTNNSRSPPPPPKGKIEPVGGRAPQFEKLCCIK